MAININDILTPMLAAAKGAIGEKWPDVKEYAETEFKKIGENIILIGKMRLGPKPISEEQAKLLFNIQKNASRAVLLCIEGIGLLIAEKAINDAIDAVKTIINNAIGFTLV